MREHLEPSVGEALINDEETITVMSHPKMVEAIGKLKEDPSAYHRLVADDEELRAMFEVLRVNMEQKEAEAGEGTAEAAKGPPALEDSGVPALVGAEEAEAEEARAEGTAAFTVGDYATAAARYERAAALQPSVATHWTNLSVARLRCGRAPAAVEAAREATRLSPRFAKGWLRLGEALHEIGEAQNAVTAFEFGLQRAEGAVRLALTKGLQRANAAARQGQQQQQPQPNAKAPKPPAAAPSATSKGSEAANAAASGDADSAAPTPPPNPPPPKPLPTLEDERRLARETAALRAASGDAMQRYAELAKSQTQAAAIRAVRAAIPQAAPSAVAPAAPPAAPAAPASSAAAASDARRRVEIADEDFSDDADDAAESTGWAAPAAEAAVARGGAAKALEGWAEERLAGKRTPATAALPAKAEGAGSGGADAAPPARKVVAPMPLANAHIFDLA